MNRSAAREETFKLVYSLEIQKEDLKEQTEIYLENAEISDENTKEYMSGIVEGIEENITAIEGKISENLKKDWKLERISKINLVLLKLAIYEILYTDYLKIHHFLFYLLYNYSNLKQILVLVLT